MNPTFRNDTPSFARTGDDTTFLVVLEASPSIRNRSTPVKTMSACANEKCSEFISSKMNPSDVKLQQTGERVPTRSFAVPMSLKNLKADLMASSSSKPMSTTLSITKVDSGHIPTKRKRNAPGAHLDNNQNSPLLAPPRTEAQLLSQRSTQNQPVNEQQQEEEDKLPRNPNAPLHRPYKQQRSLSPTPRSKSASNDNNKQKEQQQQEEQHAMEDDSSCASARSILPPLWTEGFAKGVSNSVKKTVDSIILQGSLLNAPKRKFWSSLTPKDIHRSSAHSDGNDDEEEDDVLGSGSFSKVTKVLIKGKESRGNDSFFALKRLKGDLLPSKLTEQSCKNGSVIAFTKAATELAREAFLLSRLDHPHIINIMGWTDGGVTSYSVYRRHDAYFLVLELLQEETLDDRIDGWNQDDAYLRTTQCMEERLKAHFHRRRIEQLTICKQIASALAYVHSKNVVYRDLKPQNIGFARDVDDEGNEREGNVVVKLMDFGLARELPSGGTIFSPSNYLYQQSNFRSHIALEKNPLLFDMTGTVGTIRYMAPEVCLNRPYGLECDIYSWSIVAHEILSQTKPYDDMTPDMYQSLVCHQGVRPPTEKMPSEHIVLLTQAWRTDPSKRLPLNRIQRQLELFLQQEKLMLEAHELLSDMPEKRESPIFLSQSYSDDNIGSRIGSRRGGGGGRGNKRSWYRANNVDRFPDRTPRKNPIFPNASMDYNGENPDETGYHNDYCEKIPSSARNTFVYQQPSIQQSHFETTILPPRSRLPEPVTPDGYYIQQKQQMSHKRTIPSGYKNSIYDGYHYNHHNSSHNGARTHNGHLDPNNNDKHWNCGFY